MDSLSLDPGWWTRTAGHGQCPSWLMDTNSWSWPVEPSFTKSWDRSTNKKAAEDKFGQGGKEGARLRGKHHLHKFQTYHKDTKMRVHLLMLIWEIFFFSCCKFALLNVNTRLSGSHSLKLKVKKERQDHQLSQIKSSNLLSYFLSMCKTHAWK